MQTDRFCPLSQRKGTDVWLSFVADSKWVEPFCENRNACVDCGAASLKARVKVCIWVGSQTIQFWICKDVVIHPATGFCTVGKRFPVGPFHEEIVLEGRAFEQSPVQVAVNEDVVRA